METDFENTKNKIRQELSDFLGVEAEDIEDETSLSEDLHMKASDLTDFMEILGRMGMDTHSMDLTELETFSDFCEALTAHQ
jgi:acyl carrier protein